MALVTVQMEDYELLEMLLDRLSHWGRDDERDLYEQMYENMLYGGCFEYGEFNVMSIVDNDVAVMYLFDNEIAFYNPTTKVLQITTAGWNTATTRERLNGLPNVSVTQRKGQLYLNGKEWDGELTVVE